MVQFSEYVLSDISLSDISQARGYIDFFSVEGS